MNYGDFKQVCVFHCISQWLKTKHWIFVIAAIWKEKRPGCPFYFRSASKINCLGGDSVSRPDISDIQEISWKNVSFNITLVSQILITANLLNLAGVKRGTNHSKIKQIVVHGWEEVLTIQIQKGVQWERIPFWWNLINWSSMYNYFNQSQSSLLWFKLQFNCCNKCFDLMQFFK